MKIIVLGVRGIPNVQGGVETHAEHLYARLAELGCDIEVIVRTPFVARSMKRVGQIRITRIWSPRTAGLEAFVHSVLGVLYAAWVRPDILHIHAIGPAIVVPLARLFRLKVVMTHHGPDYDRDKWGPVARLVLRAGERWGVRYSHARIAISRVIANLIARYGQSSRVIPNGVVRHVRREDSEHVLRFGLVPGKYVLQVSRIVPEKRQLDLIHAFSKSGLAERGLKLALVGGLTEDDYCDDVVAAAEAAGVVLTGFQKGAALEQLYSHAACFVLPSTHEGLPIALLEALCYGLAVLASDIPANVEIGLERSSYFPVGDRDALAQALSRIAAEPIDPAQRQRRIDWVMRTYDWNLVAAQTMEVYLVLQPELAKLAGQDV
jgi:glycosyltransferase involved in cell wall biosynthesis